MKKLLLGSVVLTSVMSSGAFAHEGCNMFEKNPLNTTGASTATLDPNKTEEKFNLIIDRVVNLYSGTIKNLGVEFKVEKKWSDATENAYARKNGQKWSIHMLGGLYKNAKVTGDALALVTCHELGHLVGGAPFKNKTALMSVEGQADYWGSAVCLKKYFLEYPEKVVLKDNIVKRKCDNQYPSDYQSRVICYRSALAGHSIANFFSYGLTPSFAINSPLKRFETFQQHPEAQCRLDTYIAGSLCQTSDDSDRFEEKLLSDKLTTDFLCKNDNEGTLIEKRPSCWFNAKNNSIYAEWKKTVKSQSIFGLKKGKVIISYRNHLPGNYNIRLIPSEETATSDFLELVQDSFVKELPAASQMVEVKFDYNFIKKAKQQLKFILIIEFNNEQIYRNQIAINAYANI